MDLDISWLAAYDLVVRKISGIPDKYNFFISDYCDLSRNF